MNSLRLNNPVKITNTNDLNLQIIDIKSFDEAVEILIASTEDSGSNSDSELTFENNDKFYINTFELQLKVIQSVLE